MRLEGPVAISVILIAGCGSASAPPASVPTPVPRNDRAVVSADEARESLVARAEQALVDDLALDYERPFERKSLERPDTVAKLREACEAGHARSCWKAAIIAPRGDVAELNLLVAANCRAGDHMSCRALPDVNAPGKPVYPDLPGALGRSLCQDTNDCDLTAMRRECDDGFAWSCFVLQNMTRDNKDADAVRKRLSSLVVENCKADITFFCSSMVGMVDIAPADQVRMDERLCALERACSSTAQHLAEQGRLTEARDASERSCQFMNSPRWCAELGAAYLDERYEEPVPGRGQELVNSSCRNLGKYAATVPVCKRAKL